MFACTHVQFHIPIILNMCLLCTLRAPDHRVLSAQVHLGPANPDVVILGVNMFSVMHMTCTASFGNAVCFALVSHLMISLLLFHKGHSAQHMSW